MVFIMKKAKKYSPAEVTPKGFLFSSVEAAIKKPGRKDLTLIYSEKEAVMAGMFTTNKIKAAPVKLDMKRIRSGKGRAIIANSGNANACTGEKGIRDSVAITDLIAKGLKVRNGDVYICSTGVIGTPMPVERICQKIPSLVAGLGKHTIQDAASAIMTTDTFPKVVTKKLRIGGKTATLTGICKGAGMICPNMATMLCFIMTDLNISRTALNAALKRAVGKTFNRITIDGDMSTNDTVLIMANGMAGNNEIRINSVEFRTFESALLALSLELSRLIVKDGEGATKLVEVEIRNAKNQKDADGAAFAVANSLLVKTAMYGNDANWGRIMGALGRSGITIKENRTDIYFGKVRVVKGGISTGRDNEANIALREKEIKLIVDLQLGDASSKVLTCDLTEGYVRINAEYRT